MRWSAALLLSASTGLLAGGLVGAGSPPPSEIAAGQEIYERCAACHALERDRTGPRHCGLFGRRAGSVPGFAYSEAMRTSGIVWNRQTLDVFIANPLGRFQAPSWATPGSKTPRNGRSFSRSSRSLRGASSANPSLRAHRENRLGIVMPLQKVAERRNGGRTSHPHREKVL
jgi:cytochrome c